MKDRARLVVFCLGLALVACGCTQPAGMWGGFPTPVPTQVAQPGPPGKVPATAAAPRGKSAGDSVENPLTLARLCERRGQVEQAERFYQETIRRWPENPVPHHRLAVLYAQRSKWKEAEEAFGRAMALKPDDPELLADLGYFCYLSGRLDEAERHLRRAVEIEPNESRYCTNLALVLGEQGRDAECLALLRRANPPNHAIVNHAYVLAQRGEYRRAMDAYNQALTEDRTLRVAADAMIEISKYVPETGNRQPANIPAHYLAYEDASLGRPPAQAAGWARPYQETAVRRLPNPAVADLMPGDPPVPSLMR